MSIIVEYSIPASQFILGRALQDTSALEIELEQMVPTGSKAIPYFWVIDDDRTQFENVLDRESGLSKYEVVDELDERTLYRAEWDLSDDTFVQAIVDHDAVLQQGGGDARSWTFQLRFPDVDTVSDFRTACRSTGIDTTVKRMYRPAEHPDSTSLMTDAQRAIVELAYERGYFDVPRKVTLEDLAEQVGISDQAVNERLRRGLKALIGSTLKSPTDEDD